MSLELSGKFGAALAIIISRTIIVFIFLFKASSIHIVLMISLVTRHFLLFHIFLAFLQISCFRFATISVRLSSSHETQSLYGFKNHKVNARKQKSSYFGPDILNSPPPFYNKYNMSSLNLMCCLYGAMTSRLVTYLWRFLLGFGIRLEIFNGVNCVAVCEGRTSEVRNNRSFTLLRFIFVLFKVNCDAMERDAFALDVVTSPRHIKPQ